MNEDEYRLEEYTDFMIKIYRGAVVSKDSNRVEIEIYSSILKETRNCKININGKDYSIPKGFLEPAVFPQINKVLKSYEIPVAKSICIHPVCQRNIQGNQHGNQT